MSKHILMIAFNYPPSAGSSGVHRTLKFSQYLLGAWKPIVLTAHPRAYDAIDQKQIDEIPQQVHVKRAFALDSAKHLAIAGRYPGLLALPDRWVSWVIGGVLSGSLLIRRYRPQVIWATFPISSAVLIGVILKKWFNLPFIVDFRDPMTKSNYPQGRLKFALTRWIEKNAIRLCDYAVFTTERSRNVYAARYGNEPAEKWQVIANGYDEETFQGLGDIGRNVKHEKMRLIHSGVLYPHERDPSQFFQAIANLKQQGKINAATHEIVLRATMHDDVFIPELQRLNIADVVSLQPAISYKAALHEMLQADGLLILQASSCNGQIPAKAYEYIRAARPIMALTDHQGDTAQLLLSAGYTRIAPLDECAAIEQCLLAFIQEIDANSAYVCDAQKALRYSRKARTGELLKLLESL